MKKGMIEEKILQTINSPADLKELDLSYLSANLDGISFHDSIVVFDKKKRSLPKSELR